MKKLREQPKWSLVGEGGSGKPKTEGGGYKSLKGAGKLLEGEQTEFGKEKKAPVISTKVEKGGRKEHGKHRKQ